MLEVLKALKLNQVYPLETVYNKLVEKNHFNADFATLITLLWKNSNFSLSLPHNQPPSTFTIKRINDYE